MDNTDLTWKDYARELCINIARARTAKGYPRIGSRPTRVSRALPTRGMDAGNRTPTPPANPRLRSILAVVQAFDVELADLLPKHPPDFRRR